MWPTMRCAGGIVLSVAAIVGAASSQTGQTLVVNGLDYYVAPNVMTVIDLSNNQIQALSGGDDDVVPLTVMADPTNLFTSSVFTSIVNNFTASDDVFNTGFLQAVFLFHTGPGSANIQDPLDSSLTQLFIPAKASNYKIFGKGQSQTPSNWKTAIPEGPYFLSPTTGEVFQAFRLFSDVNGAFTEATIANGDGTYSVLSAALSGDQSLAIGVPSRLSFTKTAQKPLAGVRLGVKDIYDVAGLKSGLGSRAHFDLYPPVNTTGTAVQRLIDAGAIIIGKMKTSQFANGEVATDDWVDFHSPFNPRGDGYQDPSSSSSGPGAGIGAYPWLDIGLGSDTGGSIRGPSGSNGCFGNRPSHGLVALDHVMPLSPDMDTAGFLTRDPVLWHAASKVLYQTNISSTNFHSFPKTILTSGFPTTATTEAQSILLTFLSQLQSFLGATNTTALNLNTLWAATSPPAAANPVISTFMTNVYPVLIAAQQFSLFTLPFYADYAAAHSGRRPFIDPVPLVRWAYGESFGSNAAEEANLNRTIFKRWWETHVVLPSVESCSESLVLYPGNLAGTSYRNAYSGPPSPPTGFSISRVSNFAEIPDFVFVIGQAPYNSTISLQEEFLPVSVDIMAAKGCDGMIFALAEQLLAAGILKIPKTGSMTF